MNAVSQLTVMGRGGREALVVRAAGFDLTRVVPTGGSVTIVEARPTR